MQMLQAVSVVVGAVEFAWVPGTMNRVQARMPEGEVEISLEQLTLLTGQQAVHDLYLKGIAHAPLVDRLREALLQK